MINVKMLNNYKITIFTNISNIFLCLLALKIKSITLLQHIGNAFEFTRRRIFKYVIVTDLIMGSAIECRNDIF